MSVREDIAEAVVDAVDALALSGAPAAVRQKIPALPPDVNPPRIVVSVAALPKTETITNGHRLKRYKGAVTIYTAGGTQLADDDALGAWVEAIREALERWEIFASVAAFNDVTVEDATLYPTTALGRTLSVASIPFTVETKEART